MSISSSGRTRRRVFRVLLTLDPRGVISLLNLDLWQQQHIFLEVITSTLQIFTVKVTTFFPIIILFLISRLPDTKIKSLLFLVLRQGGGRGGASQGKEGTKFCSAV